MNDKTILITGGTGGIGKQTAIALAKMGAQVFVTGRSRVSGEAAVAEIRQASGSQKVDLLLADLSRQADAWVLAEQLTNLVPHLDVLINNAGLAASARVITEDGIESNFAVNVLAPFLLTNLLMDLLRASPAARVVNLTGGDIPARLELDNLQAERSFDGLFSYSQTKLAMMAVMLEFARRVQGSNVTINVCYPGQASTAMTRGVTPEMLPGPMRLFYPLFRWLTRPDGGKSAVRASRSSVYLASAPELEDVSGKYFDTHCKMVDWPSAVLDESNRKILWERAATLVDQAQLRD